MDNDVEYYRTMFFQEVPELLDGVSTMVLEAEADPDNKDFLNSIFRNIHTIKGSAGTFGFDLISEFAHHLESLPDALREGRMILDPHIVDLVLAGVDHLTIMMGDIKSGQEASLDHDLIGRFKEACEGICTIPSNEEGVLEKSCKGDSIDTVPSEIRDEIGEYSTQGFNIFQVSLNYTSQLFESGFDQIVLLKNLKRNSEFYCAFTEYLHIPPITDFEPFTLYLHPTVYVATKLTLAEVQDLAFDSEFLDVKRITCAAPEKCEELLFIDESAIQTFLDDSFEKITTIEKIIIDYEERDSQDSLNEIFRFVHTIKGDSAYAGLKVLSEFTHELETLLSQLRSKVIRRSPEIVDIILLSLDFIKDTLDKLRQGETVQDLPPLFTRLKKTVSSPPGQEESVITVPAISEEAIQDFLDRIIRYRELLACHLDTVSTDKDSEKVVTEALIGLKKASHTVGLQYLNDPVDTAINSITDKNRDRIKESINEVASSLDRFESEPQKLGEILVAGGKLTEEEIQEALSKQKPIGRILVESGKIDEKDVESALRVQEIMQAAKKIKPVSTKESEISTMRVEESRIEYFNTLIGELLVAKNTYEYLLGELDGNHNGQTDTFKKLRDNLHLFSRLTNDMHYGVMSLRMIPVKGIFNKFVRIIRDIGRQQNKCIELEIIGEDTRIDKKVADILSEPLVHVVRNSCDHGIGTVEERKRMGKPEKGTITLKAFQEGSQLIIKISDDGKGINRERCLEKARALGIDLSTYDDEKILEVVFIPGLSTKDEVTSISGRGVGMDVVKSTVDSLGGEVHISSEEGKGTEISLHLPVSIGLRKALIVESRSGLYAIPLEYVLETIKIDKGNLRSHRDGAFFCHRDDILPVESLDTLLNGKKSCEDIYTVDNEPDSKSNVIDAVVLQIPSGKFCIAVDRLVQNMEIAIKPVPQAFHGIDVVDGVSIMGDGKVVLVVNPEKIL